MDRRYTLNSERHTVQLATALADRLSSGDTLLLSGPVGAGKSLFARALIQACQASAGAPVEEVPSPSFTLVQTYRAGDLMIWHADLYRLSDPDELAELGLHDAFADALVLVEWPELLDASAPARHLGIDLAPVAADADRRVVTLTPAGPGWHRVLAAAAETLGQTV